MTVITKKLRRRPDGTCEEIAEPVLVENVPVDRSPVPISDFYWFEPMQPAAPTELEERTLPAEMWLAPQPQPEPPGNDHIAYIDEYGRLRYMFGAHRQPPQPDTTPAWRRVASVWLRNIVGAIGAALVIGVGVGAFLWLLSRAQEIHQ